MAITRGYTRLNTGVRARQYATHPSSALTDSLKRALRRSAALDIHPEVQDALASRRPVVALETALVTNGVAPPTNLAIARKLESIVREQGAVPATIGIVDGRIKVGLQDAELVRLADTENNKRLVKVSRRDIGPAISQRMDGGTTICSTLIFAHLAGIKVFATGGLGGVHRGAQDSMDISADLHELTRCPVGVVSCGVKSILDIGRTLEYLETLGVPVVTYGDTYNFPAFFCGKSDFETNWKVNDPRTAAGILDAQARLGMQNGTLFAAPMPDSYAAQGAEVKLAVDQAILESEENGMSKKGKEVTPWLLGRVVELTQGRSLQNNLALIENTAVIGGQIAVELAKLEDQQRDSSEEAFSSTGTSTSSRATKQFETPKQDETSKLSLEVKAPPKLVVVGASAIDVTGRVAFGSTKDISQTTVPGMVSLSVGGVARNIAEAAHRILAPEPTAGPDTTLLVSPIGQDEFSPFLLEEQARLGMWCDGFIQTLEHRTAVCNITLDASGALVGGVADMDIIPNVSEKAVLEHIEHTPELVVMDGNLSPKMLTTILKHCNNRSKPIPTFFEPTSVSKSTSILPAIIEQLTKSKDITARSPVTYASPNTLELSQMYYEADSEDERAWLDVINNFNLGSEWRMDLDQLARRPACPTEDKGNLEFLLKDGIVQMSVNMLAFFQNIVIKCGERGVVVVMRISGDDIDSSTWALERSNPLRRYVVAKNLEGKEMVVLQHFPAIPMESAEIVSVTGAGDSLVGALSASLVKDPTTFHSPEKLEVAIQLAQKAAVLSLHSVRAVSPLLGRETAGAA